MKAETKIFVSVFLVVFFSAFLSVFMLIPFYYGHPLIDLGRLTSWTSSLFMTFSFSLSLLIAGVSVIFYDLYEEVKKKERNKIISKRLVVFILLLGLTLVYPLVFHYSVQAYEQECAAALERLPEEFSGYVDYPPFLSSRSGFPLMLFGACIAVSWFILFLWRK
jgi:H+/Cl- antiporter ClcA